MDDGRKRAADTGRGMWSRCDACGVGAPDVVGPILLGTMRWRTFGIDGVYEGRAWVADVLLCPNCAPRMEAFVASGGVNGYGPKPPTIKTSEGGFYVEPVYREASVAALSGGRDGE